MILRLTLALIWLALAGPLLAAPITGAVRVIDGDTLDVGDTRIRLFGIDAPEIAQPCGAGAERWACGRWAQAQVARLYEGRQAVCAAVTTDKYRRVVARCQVGGQDIGARLVSDGLALAYRRYSLDYTAQEKAALIAGRGIWRVGIERPSAFRAARAGRADACRIKGNISASGRIYHLPSQEYYAATRISVAKGERWFCSEAAARAAGWRKARR